MYLRCQLRGCTPEPPKIPSPQIQQSRRASIDYLAAVLEPVRADPHVPTTALLGSKFRCFGVLRRAGIEGTGSYGAALTQVLQGNGITVVEINRPDRSRRRGRGKSDATDAESAARSVLAGVRPPSPRPTTGWRRACVR